MPAIRALTLVLAAPIALLGPPRVTVAAGAPGAPMTVTVEHTGEVEHAVVTVRAVSREGRRTTERPVTAVETTAPAKDARAFLVTPPRTPGVPQVLVIRGAHGAEDDAPFMEALVRVNGEGAVVGIDYSQRKSLLGGYRFPAFSDEDITSALTRLAAR